MFKNSSNLPVRQTMFNLHNARKHESVVVCEASFDAMRIHQAGYPNVVAMLHGHVNPNHLALFDKYFTTIIIMTDYDDPHIFKNCAKCRKRGEKVCQGHNPGRELGEQLAAGLRQKKVLWAAWDDYVVYPHGAKDPGDLTDEEIRQCLRKPVINLEYQSWGLAK
jgi:hypothetical protein